MFADHLTNGDDTSSSVTAAPERRPKWQGLQVAAFTGQRLDWQATAERRLRHMIYLKNGWDGHQGRPVAPAIAEYAYQLLEKLLLHPTVPLPEITPLSYGGLILEWHRKGWDVEIEISSPGAQSIYTHELATGAEDELHLGYRLERLQGIIKNIAD